MQTLIRDLLSYSRVKSQGNAFQHIDANEAFKSALMNLDAAIGESDAKVTCDPLPKVWADPRQLSQLFQNLLGNAIKYRSEDTPAVHVSVSEEHDKFVFSVMDNGIGIAVEYRERIFGIFKRLHGRGEYPGTGIGLAICKRIVDRMGGDIYVESNESGGSTFCFTVKKTGTGIHHVERAYALAN